jgi:hypothetical protein
MTSAEEEADVEVRRADQDMINEFGRLNARKSEAGEEVEACRVRVQELDDVEEGILLADADDAGCLKCVVRLCGEGCEAGVLLRHTHPSVTATLQAPKPPPTPPPPPPAFAHPPRHLLRS